MTITTASAMPTASGRVVKRSRLDARANFSCSSPRSSRNGNRPVSAKSTARSSRSTPTTDSPALASATHNGMPARPQPPTTATSHVASVSLRIRHLRAHRQPATVPAPRPANRRGKNAASPTEERTTAAESDRELARRLVAEALAAGGGPLSTQRFRGDGLRSSLVGSPVCKLRVRNVLTDLEGRPTLSTANPPERGAPARARRQRHRNDSQIRIQPPDVIKIRAGRLSMYPSDCVGQSS